MESVAITGVTIGIIVKNQANKIERCLQSIFASPNPCALELIVIDHDSSDSTVEKILPSIPEGTAFRIFLNKENNLGKSRNFILHAAKHPVLCFIDSDCEAPPNWLEKLLTAFLSEKDRGRVIGVGGGNTPPHNNSIFYSALRQMSSNAFGNGNSTQARLARNPETVAHIPTCNLMLDRDLAIRLGGFSSGFNFVCEDLEFSRRAEVNGYFFLFLPDTTVFHWHDESFMGWFRKMFRYGRGQILVQRKHPRHLIGIRGLPLLFLLILLVLLFFSPSLFALAILFYLSTVLLISIFLTIGFWPSLPALIRVAFLFCGTHFAYGAGQLFELLRKNRNIEHRKVSGEKDDQGFLLIHGTKNNS